MGSTTSSTDVTFIDVYIYNLLYFINLKYNLYNLCVIKSIILKRLQSL